MPTPPHNKEVDVFFPGEQPPSNPYIRIELIEVSGAEYNSYSQLVNTMKKRAQSKGIDAVMFLGHHQTEKLMSDETLLENCSETESGESIVNTYWTETQKQVLGLGIKYIDDVDYLDQYIKAKYIYPDSSMPGSKPATEISIDIDNKHLAVEGNQTYADLVFRYSPTHLVDETNHWLFRKDEFGRTIKRSYVPGGLKHKKCNLTYDRSNRVKVIEIKNFYTYHNGREKVTYTYRAASDQLIEVEISSSLYGQLKQVFLFNDSKEPTGELWYKLIENQEVPFFRVDYELYSLQDFASQIYPKN